MPSSKPIQTTVVGSYPIPSWLATLPAASNLRDAVLVVLKTQELAGLDVLTDGELTRFDINHPETNGMIEYFTRPMEGISSALSRDEILRFRAQARTSFRTRPAGMVRSAIGPGTLDLPSVWSAVRDLTKQPLKFTVTSPYMLAKTLLDCHYKDERALAMALAEVLRIQVQEIDAAVVQLDEAHITGHLEDLAWAHEPINHVLQGVRHEKAIHLCFGNYGGQTIQKGDWHSLISFLNALHCHHLILEVARRETDEIQWLREIRSDIGLGIGVIDIKDNEVESPSVVAGRIEHAVKVLGADRVQWVHPDCGFWMLPRSVADRKMAALVAGRNLFYGKQS